MSAFMDAIPFWGNTGVLGQSGRGKVIPWFILPHIVYTVKLIYFYSIILLFRQNCNVLTLALQLLPY